MKRSCPFQVDVIIAYPHARHVDDEDEEDEDEDDDEKANPNEQSQEPVVNPEEDTLNAKSFTYFGNIKKKLDSHNLRHVSIAGDSSQVERNFLLLHREYKKKTELENAANQRYGSVCLDFRPFRVSFIHYQELPLEDGGALLFRSSPYIHDLL